MNETRSTDSTAGDGESGFALSEFVLIVVFVVGLLIVITVSVGNIRKETSTSNCQSDLRTLKLATEQYQAQNDAYPTDKATLIASRLVEADQVERWTIASGGDGATEPDFVPTDGACS